jgi:RNA polymerase sigma-70 factor (ECF subfamily)
MVQGPEGASVPRDLGEGLLQSAVTHAEKLTRFLTLRVGDAAEAQDLMQEIYLRILKLRQPEAVENSQAYLYRVAANLAYEHRLRRAAHPPHVPWDDLTEEIPCPHAAALEPATPEGAAALAERLQVLEERLHELPSKVQWAIVWHHRDGYTCDEIGERLSVVHHRVKKYLAKGLAHCRAAGLLDQTAAG